MEHDALPILGLDGGEYFDRISCCKFRRVHPRIERGRLRESCDVLYGSLTAEGQTEVGDNKRL